MCSSTVLRFIILFGTSFLTLQSVSTAPKAIQNCMPRVVINDAKETVFEMRLNGESCTFMPLIVPKKGFQFSIDATRVGRKVFLGYITFSFGDVLVNKSTLMITEDKNRVETYMQPGPEDYIEIAEVRTSTTTYTVFPNGSVMVLPLWFTQPFYIPPIENLPDFNADEKILILTINWGNLTDKFQLIFPSEIRFLLPVQNSTVIPQLETTKITTLVATTQSNVSVSVTTRFFDENWWRIVDGIGVVFAFSGVFIAGVMVYKIIHLIRNVPVESQSMSTVPSIEASNEPAATLTGQQNELSTVPNSSTVDPYTATSSVAPSSEPQNLQTTVNMETGEHLIFIAKASKSTIKKKKSNRAD